MKKWLINMYEALIVSMVFKVNDKIALNKGK